jgi:tRNA-specific 2-thiouridylase
LAAKTRYRMPDAACTLTREPQGAAALFDAPQWAPTPGQYLVLYDGDICLGGGVIAAQTPSSGAAVEAMSTALIDER